MVYFIRLTWSEIAQIISFSCYPIWLLQKYNFHNRKSHDQVLRTETQNYQKVLCVAVIIILTATITAVVNGQLSRYIFAHSLVRKWDSDVVSQIHFADPQNAFLRLLYCCYLRSQSHRRLDFGNIWSDAFIPCCTFSLYPDWWVFLHFSFSPYM